MDFYYFLVRHTPFWAIPSIIIGLEFAYRYWLKRKKIVYGTIGAMILHSLIALVFYLWAGGPEESVRIMMDIFGN